MRRAAVVAVLLAVPLARTCITVAGTGKAPVVVADETALIVWDAATRTERFVRTATFTGADGPVGFLVPTPAPPTLKALPGLGFDDDGGTMDELKTQIAPRIETRKRPVYQLSDGWDFTSPMVSDAAATATKGVPGDAYAGDVDVLSASKVGGYDTAVLRADDPKALLRWLKAHGFASDARLEGWLRPYTEKGWAITAFRFKPDGKAFESEPVGLTFKTDRPFYPYREPADGRSPASRSLRVFLVTPDRRAGRLDTGAWPTAAEYAAPLANATVAALAGGLELPASTFRGEWLTSFLDRRPARPDSELWFDADGDQRWIEPPPLIQYEDDPVVVPKGLAATVAGLPILGLAAFGVRWKRRG